MTLLQVHRVLKGGGRFLFVTFRQPHFMTPLLNLEGLWTVHRQVLGDNAGGFFDYYGYLMRKAPIENTENPPETGSVSGAQGTYISTTVNKIQGNTARKLSREMGNLRSRSPSMLQAGSISTRLSTSLPASPSSSHVSIAWK